MTPRLMATSLALVVCSCSGQSSQALSDSEAKRIIEKAWNDDFIMIPLGQLTVIGGLTVSPDRKLDSMKREIDIGSLRSLQVFEQMGVLLLTPVEDLTKRFTTWENWLAMTQNGVQLRISATQGARAEALWCTGSQKPRAIKTYGDTNVLCIPGGTATIDRVVRNEERTIGVDNYRAVLGTHLWKTSVVMEEFYKSTGQEQKAERKFMVVLKHDEFNGEWRVVAIDIANRDTEFATHNVNNLLAQK